QWLNGKLIHKQGPRSCISYTQRPQDKQRLDFLVERLIDVRKQNDPTLEISDYRIGPIAYRKAVEAIIAGNFPDQVSRYVLRVGVPLLLRDRLQHCRMRLFMRVTGRSSPGELQNFF